METRSNPFQSNKSFADMQASQIYDNFCSLMHMTHNHTTEKLMEKKK